MPWSGLLLLRPVVMLLHVLPPQWRPVVMRRPLLPLLQLLWSPLLLLLLLLPLLVWHRLPPLPPLLLALPMLLSR